MRPSHLLTAALATLTTATPHRRAPAAPRLATVEFAGNGCADSSTPTITGSTGRLSLTFPDLAAELGGPDPSLRIRNCIAMLSIDEGVPGYALALRRVSGSANFYGSPGASLTVISTAYWTRDAEFMVERNKTYTPPDDRPALQPITFDFDYADPEAPLMSGCVGEDGNVGSAIVNLRAFLRDAGGEGAVAAFVGTEGSPVSEEIEFAWVECGQPPVDFETPGEGDEEGEGEGDGEDEGVGDEAEGEE